VGVPILTTIGELGGWRAAFLVAGAAAVLIVVLVTAWLPPDAQQPDDTLRVRTLLRAYQPLLHDGGMRRLFACSVLRSLCWVGLLTYLGAFLRDRYDLTTSETGLVYMVGGTGYFLGSLVAGGPFARLPARPLVAIGNGVMALFMMVAFSAWLGTLVTVGVLALAAAAAAIGWVGLTALMTTETPAGAGTTMVLNSALFSLGAAAGTAIGGVLLAVGGFDALAVGLPVVGIGSALCLWTPSPR
jgi:DHA1 family inner membrane transport protein